MSEHSTPLGRVLETSLYAPDLEAAAHFYGTVLGLELIGRQPDRHLFFRCGEGMLLVFNPAVTSTHATVVGGAPVPLHGAAGAGHVAFAVEDAEIPVWRARLKRHAIAIESEVTWPRGGRSVYVRDPAGNSIELAAPSIWGLPPSARLTPQNTE